MKYESAIRTNQSANKATLNQKLSVNLSGFGTFYPLFDQQGVRLETKHTNVQSYGKSNFHTPDIFRISCIFPTTAKNVGENNFI